MSRWNHACCELCFLKRHPGQAPHRVPIMYRELEICCHCFKNTTAGIFDRDNPDDTRCKGHMTPTHRE